MARLARARGAGNEQECAGARSSRRVDEKAPHGLVAAADARVVDAAVAQPLLHDLRAQTAAKAVQVAVGVRLGEARQAAIRASRSDAADQLVAQGDRRGLARCL
jgi:hypothetical protein